MKEFLQVLRRFVPPYKKYLALSVAFNILSAILNIFSFAALIPILNILFNTGDAETATQYIAWGSASAREVVTNNHGKTKRACFQKRNVVLPSKTKCVLKNNLSHNKRHQD